MVAIKRRNNTLSIVLFIIFRILSMESYFLNEMAEIFPPTAIHACHQIASVISLV